MKIRINSFTMMVIMLFLMPIFSGRARNTFFSIIFILAINIFFKNGGKFIYKNKHQIEYHITISVSVLITYIIINFFLNGTSYEAFKRLFQLVVSFSILLATSRHKVSQKEWNHIIRLIKIMVLLSFILWPFSGFTINNYSAIYSRGNSMGAALFCYFALYLYKNKLNSNDKVILFFMTLLTLLANSRSVLLSLVTFMICKFIFSKSKNKKYRSLYDISIAIACLIPGGYMWLYNSNFKEAINVLSRKYFRKRFFSGRQYLWGILLQYIAAQIFWGYGLSVTPETLLGGKWSAHNWYLQTLLQIGIIGFVIIIVILRFIWFALYQNKTKVTINGSAFLIGVLVWQCFEVAITQNNFSVGVMVWFVLGLALNPSFQELLSKS